MKCYSTEKAGGAEGAAHKAEQEKQKNHATFRVFKTSRDQYENHGPGTRL